MSCFFAAEKKLTKSMTFQFLSSAGLTDDDFSNKTFLASPQRWHLSGAHHVENSPVDTLLILFDHLKGIKTSTKGLHVPQDRRDLMERNKAQLDLVCLQELTDVMDLDLILYNSS